MEIFWFIVVAFLWCVFFVLEGFDFGVGMLNVFLGRTDTERRVVINSIGPYWDGNEVWLIVAGAGIFAAFPDWYATMFSALYLPLVVVLLALMMRGVTFEWRGKSDHPAWRNRFSWMLAIGSFLVPLLVGVALGDLLVGLPIDRQGEFTGNFLDLLTPYGLWTGLTLFVLSLAHGAAFLDLKTTGIVRERAHRLTAVVPWIAAVCVIVLVFWTNALGDDSGVIPGLLGVAAILTVIAAAWSARDGYAGWAFAMTAATLGSAVGSIFVSLYPHVMISSTDKAYSLTVAGAASGHYALTVMTVVAVLFAPLVIAYQAWSYHVFRARVRGPERATEPTGSEADQGSTGPASV